MRQYHGTEIAVVGLSGRFPGAADVDAFWSNLRAGVESLSRFTDEQLLAEGVRPHDLASPAYVKAGFAVDGRARFDAALFEIAPQQALAMDPQQRHFLECCWAALEHAGYAPRRCEQLVGVYGGSSTNAYLLFHLWPQLMRDPAAGFAEVMSATSANAPERLTTRVSYKLGLRGPSVAVSSACSTSLVAVHLACQGLLALECDMALAGGTGMGAGFIGHRFMRDSALSSDGHCRPFDAHADGTTGGSGVGVVVLKRLADALADGDTIHALILGSAVNNDGADKIGYAAPSVEGQRRVLELALGVADVSADSIGYIEAHGTATPLGDPIEIRAITRAYGAGTGRTQPCAIGSVKANIGHLDAAAGIAGLIKTVLMVKHGELPPSINFTSPNPEIAFDDSPVHVQRALAPWISAGPRRAAVSAFGIGGTNAHVVVEEPPAVQSERASIDGATPRAERPWQLLCLSARTDTALDQMTANLRDHLEAQRALALEDVAFTLQCGRAQLERRRVIVAGRGEALAAVLARMDRSFTGVAADKPVRPVFVFSGARRDDARTIAAVAAMHEPVVREEREACALALRRGWGIELDGADPAPAVATARAFVAQAAVARLLLSLGVVPRGLVGEDVVGDSVAAYLAGVLGIEDALASALAGSPAALSQAVASARRQRPALPLLDRSSETIVSAERATDPGYWLDRLLGAVPALEVARRAGLVVDLGGGAGRADARADRYVAVPPAASVSDPGSDPASDLDRAFTQALGRLWTLGVDVDWPSYHRGRRARRVPLPTYPFEGETYWQPVAAPAALAGPTPWMSERSWHRRPALTADPARCRGTSWLLFTNLHGVGAALRDLLEASGATVVTAARRGAPGEAAPEPSFDPARPREMAPALQRLVQRVAPQHVVYLWSLEQPDGEAAEALAITARILGAEPRTSPLPVIVATRRGFDVHGGEPVAPTSPWLANAGRILGDPAKGLSCRVVDLDAAHGDDASRLLAEALDGSAVDAVAWRGRYRWLPALDAVALRDARPGDPLQIVVGGVDHVDDLATLASLGEALAPGSTVRFTGRLRVPARAEVHARELAPSLVPDSPLGGLDAAALVQAIERDAARLHGEQERYPDVEGFVAGAEALCARWVLDHFIAGGTDTAPGARHALRDLCTGVRPELHKLVGFLVEVLRRGGVVAVEGDAVTFRAHALPEAGALRRRFLAAHPAFEAWCELVERCVRAYPDVLSGRVHPHEVLYPGGNHELLRDMERRTPDITNQRACHRALVKAVEHLGARASQRLRILEVGGGTGTVTWDLLDALAGRPIDYLFTDIGRTFVTEAERKAAGRGIDGMRFATYDIARDPAAQGLAPGSVDVIVAFNVVQAAPRIAPTLQRLRSLLAPGGVLLMMNTVGDLSWYGLVFGLAKGWWDFADEPLRVHGPALSAAAWQDVMAAQGFRSVRAFPPDPREQRAIVIGLQDDRGATSVDAARAVDDAARRLAALEHRGVHVLALADPPVAGPVDGVVLLERVDTALDPLRSYAATVADAERRAEARRRWTARSVELGARFRIQIEVGARAGNRRVVADPADPGARWSTVEAGAISAAGMAALMREVLPPARDAVDLVVNDQALARSPARDAGEARAQQPARDPVVSEARAEATGRAALERAIGAMWQEVLGIPPVDPQTYFFEVGGDSLAGLQLQARVQAAYGIELSLGDLLAEPSLAGMVATVERLLEARRTAPPVELIPIVEQHGGDLQALIDTVGGLSDEQLAAFERANRRS